MEIIKELIEEFETEAAKTKKMIGRIPMEFFEYKPHEKSMTIGRLAVHIVEMAGWTRIIVNENELDFAKMPYNPPTVDTLEDLLTLHQQCVSEAVEVLKTTDIEALKKDWTLRSGDYIIFTMSKYKCFRSMVLNHIVHHRGQLSVYLRLLNVPIPGMYGPSADES